MRIALIGDIAPIGRYCLHRDPGLLSYFKAVRECLETHDVIVANLEAPLVDGSKPNGAKSAHIKAHPRNVELLRYLGVTHVTLANNHIGDYGLFGYESTKKLLEDVGIGWFGAEGRALRLEVGDEKLSLAGFCSLSTNPAKIRLRGKQVLNLLDAERVAHWLQQESASGYFPVLAVHNGQEHVHLPSSDDVNFARALAQKVNFVYYGHHPHVLQGCEQVHGSVCFYSLGNFVFDDVYSPRNGKQPLVKMTEANKSGGVASIEIVDNQVVNWRFIPTYLGDSCMAVGNYPQQGLIEEYSRYLPLAGTSEYDDARRDMINEFFESRRSTRDAAWYLRRLNFSSIRMIASVRRNAEEHRRIFTSKLPGLSR